MDNFTLKNFFDTIDKEYIEKVLLNDNEFNYKYIGSHEMADEEYNVKLNKGNIFCLKKLKPPKTTLSSINFKLSYCGEYFFATVFDKTDALNTDLIRDFVDYLYLDFCFINGNFNEQHIREYRLICVKYNDVYIYINKFKDDYERIVKELKTYTFTCVPEKKPLLTDTTEPPVESEEPDKIYQDDKDSILREFEKIKSPENDFVCSKEKKIIIDKFKKDFNDFTHKYPKSKDEDSILRIESLLSNAMSRTNDLTLFKEPNSFYSEIPTKEKIYLEEKFSDMRIFNKMSASSSYVFRTRYVGKPAFI